MFRNNAESGKTVLKIKTNAEDMTATLLKNLDIHMYALVAVAPILRCKVVFFAHPGSWLNVDQLTKKLDYTSNILLNSRLAFRNSDSHF